MNDLELGFHNRDGWMFRREAEGVVRIWKVRWENATPVLEAGPHLIPENEWASIVASVSKLGETASSWQAARDFHNSAPIGYIARSKSSGEFACSGQETGMGAAIEHTRKPLKAKRSGTPGGLMLWMGGHYRGYEAVGITATGEIGAVVPFPPESEVFER